jgi:hypothetical protein
MKTLIIILGVFLAGINIGYAQNTETKTERAAKKMIEKMKEVCVISDEQATKVEPIAETYVKGINDNKEKYAKDPDGLKLADKTTRDSYMEALKTVLRPEQLQEYTTYENQNSSDVQAYYKVTNTTVVKKDSVH